ncbi:MAG: hypothetical protein ABL973_06155 [Micropepsaceae bacterium]
MNLSIAPKDGWTEPSDAMPPAVAWPTVMPVSRPRATRRVGTIKSYSERKAFGLLLDENGASDAFFTTDDVAPCDRHRIREGQTVTYLGLLDLDGMTAKQIRIDQITLPPPPPDLLFTKGWR